MTHEHPEPQEVIMQLREHIPNTRLGNGFGLTETSSLWTSFPTIRAMPTPSQSGPVRKSSSSTSSGSMPQPVSAICSCAVRTWRVEDEQDRHVARHAIGSDGGNSQEVPRLVQKATSAALSLGTGERTGHERRKAGEVRATRRLRARFPEVVSCRGGRSIDDRTEPTGARPDGRQA